MDLATTYPTLTTPHRVSPQYILYKPYLSLINGYIPLLRRKNIFFDLYWFNGTLQYDRGSDTISRNVMGFLGVRYTGASVRPQATVPTVSWLAAAGIMTPHDDDDRTSLNLRMGFADQNWISALPYTAALRQARATSISGLLTGDSRLAHINILGRPSFESPVPIYGSQSQMTADGNAIRTSILGIANTRTTQISTGLREFDSADTSTSPVIRLSNELDYALERVVRSTLTSIPAGTATETIPSLSTMRTGTGSAKYGLGMARSVIGDYIGYRRARAEGSYNTVFDSAPRPTAPTRNYLGSPVVADNRLSPNVPWCVPRLDGWIRPALLGFSSEALGTADPNGIFRAKVVLTRR